ncbi:MAG: bifunctional enoyl-CoA hydratase/phosphate acetyltransferase [Thermodesulfobacteriota bacterium]
MTNDKSDNLENHTFEEIQIGNSASLTRTLTKEDIQLFAVMSGDVNPTHLDEEFANKFLAGGLAGHSMWSGSIVSAILGTELPGPGTIYLSQDLRFLRTINLNDTVTVNVTAREKRPNKKSVIFDCSCINQRGETVMTGTAEVIAPSEKIVIPRPLRPEISLQMHDKYARLIERCSKFPSIVTAVAHPCDESSLTAVLDAVKTGIIEAILVGPAHKIKAVADGLGFDISAYLIVDAPHSHGAAAKAVELIREGKAEVLMKGSLHTDELMREVVRSDTGLRTKRRITHAFIMDVPTYHKPLIITDAAVNIYPELDEKVDICQNAIDLAHVLGIECPKVAILSAVETVNPKIKSTIEAAALCKMADRGQITGALLDGPLAFDNAISKMAAKIKKIESSVAGDADVILVPDLESGNILAKQLTFMANADAAGIVLGARVPIVLTSRADSGRSRIASCAIAALIADARRRADAKSEV